MREQSSPSPPQDTKKGNFKSNPPYPSHASDQGEHLPLPNLVSQLTSNTSIKENNNSSPPSNIMHIPSHPYPFPRPLPHTQGSPLIPILSLPSWTLPFRRGLMTVSILQNPFVILFPTRKTRCSLKSKSKQNKTNKPFHPISVPSEGQCQMVSLSQ